MSRKRLTQMFPWLLPLRKRQRRLLFYLKMRFDKHRYSRTLAADKNMPYQLFASSCALYNHSTGFSMTYQENKVFNLKLVAQQMDGLLIYPGETFSFWQLARYADKKTPYKETDNTYQIRISFDEENITTAIYTLYQPELRYQVCNGPLRYWQQGDTIYEEIAVLRQAYSYANEQPVATEPLYTNQCIITYPLPEGTVIARKEPEHE